MSNIFASIGTAKDPDPRNLLDGAVMQSFSHVSPSSLTLFAGCPRKWWLSYIAGIREPTSPAQEEGVRVHKEVENYLLKGEPLTGRAASCMAFLPTTRVPAELVEAPFAIQDPELPVPVIGQIDLLEPDLDRITDHKTTSNIRYAKTSTELSVNTQGVVYAHVLAAWLSTNGRILKFYKDKRQTYPFFRYTEPKRDVQFRHLYYPPNGQGREVTGVIDSDNAKTVWSDVRANVLEMHKLSLVDSVRRVPPNVSHCGAYGGCPRRDFCNLIDKDNAFMTTPLPGVLRGDALKTALNQEKTQAEQDVLTNTKTMLRTEAKQAKTSGKNLGEAIASLVFGWLSQQPDPKPSSAEAVDIIKQVFEGAPVQLPKAEPVVSINPPDGVPEDVTAPPVPEPVKAKVKKVVEDIVVPDWPELREFRGPWSTKGKRAPSLKRLRELMLEMLENAPRDLQLEYQNKTNTPTVADSLGRDELLEDIQLLIAVLEHQEIQPEQPKVEPPQPEQPKVEAAPQPQPKVEAGLVLYIDCLPNSPVQDFAQALQPLMDEIATELKVPHYSLADYNKGERGLAALLGQKCRERKPFGAYYINSQLPAMRFCLEVLMPYATTVIRAVR